MKAFKVAVTNMGGFNQVGRIAVKGDFVSNGFVNGKDFITHKRADADKFAQNRAAWNSQFDDQEGVAFLVCRKTPRKGWVVVAQF